MIMARYNIRPYDDYEAWDTAETIEEARDKRSKLAMSFFSRAVVIEDTNDYSIVDWVLARVDYYYSSLILTLATHQERNESTHQEKNKTWSSRKKQDPTVKS